MQSVGRLTFALLLAAGCADEGGYELHWTIGGAPAVDACAPNGLDFVFVYVVRGEGDGCQGEVVDLTDYPCHEGIGSQSLIEPGTYRICAEALSPAGVRLTGLVARPGVRIRDGETTVVDDPPLDFPAVPQCRNGLDDDGDRRIDLEDQECSDDSDDAE